MELTDWTYTNGSGQIDELVFNVWETTTLLGKYQKQLAIWESFRYLMSKVLDWQGKFPKKSHLTYLNIAQNSFKGELPASFGGLTHLIYILAANAGLSGRILGELSNCKKLRILNLSF